MQKQKIEEQVRRRERRTQIQRALTVALYRFGTYQAAVFASEAWILKRVAPELLDKGNPARRIRQALQRLERRGLVRRDTTTGRWSASLTAEGKKFAEKLHTADKIRIKKTQKWDGKWRMIVFDVWERRRNVRDKLRRALIKAGFYRLQDSIWVYPYDCEELLSVLRADLRLENGVLYVIAEGIEGDSKLKDYFGLK